MPKDTRFGVGDGNDESLRACSFAEAQLFNGQRTRVVWLTPDRLSEADKLASSGAVVRVQGKRVCRYCPTELSESNVGTACRRCKSKLNQSLLRETVVLASRARGSAAMNEEARLARKTGMTTTGRRAHSAPATKVSEPDRLAA
jgi:hypothetical protein